ncbi:MAG: hypothetical protein WD627_09685 [Actinomycetota bacterium]
MRKAGVIKGVELAAGPLRGAIYTARMKLAFRSFGSILIGMILLGAACGRPSTTYRLFTSEEGGFQAEFPSEPKREAVSVTGQGTTLNLIAFTSETPIEAVSVSFVDYPQQIDDSNRQAVINGAATGAASTLRGTLQSSRPTSFLGYDALDFVIDSDDGKATASVFLVGNRMYLLQVVQTQPEEDSESFERLLSTFKVVPGPTPSPGGEASPSPQTASPAADANSPSPVAGSTPSVDPSLLFPFPQKP